MLLPFTMNFFYGQPAEPLLSSFLWVPAAGEPLQITSMACPCLSLTLVTVTTKIIAFLGNPRTQLN